MCSTKRMLALALAAVVLLVAGSPASATGASYASETSPTSFTDVLPDHWAYKEIIALTARRILAGFEDQTFRPSKAVSRAEFAKMMVLALGLAMPETGAGSFIDLPRGHWAGPFVESAKYYLTGFRTSAGDYFRPSMAAVREDMAVALVKAMGFERDTPNEQNLGQFADGLDVSKNLVSYVAIALARGIMYGYEEGGLRLFRPQGLLTRAEAAVLLYKLGGAEEKVTYSSGQAAPPVVPQPPGPAQSPPPTTPPALASYAAPDVTGKVDGYRIILTWKPILDPRFNSYKVVASRSNPAPSYPDDGYLFYITDKNQVTAVIENGSEYNGGDIGGHFIVDQAYYFSVTALYNDAKIKGNAIRLVLPAR